MIHPSGQPVKSRIIVKTVKNKRKTNAGAKNKATETNTSFDDETKKKPKKRVFFDP